MYHVPKAYIKSANGIDVQFSGITRFKEDYDNSLMFNAISGETGLFKGKIGHPPPSKISEEQKGLYFEQLQQIKNLQSLDPEVKEKITNGIVWSFDVLKDYVSKVQKSSRSAPVSTPKQSSTNAMEKEMLEMKDREEDLVKQLKMKDEEIIKLQASKDEPEAVLEIVKANKLQIFENTKMLETVTTHIEHMINQKGKYQAFLKGFKAPLSIEVDKASLLLFIMGPEQVMNTLGTAGGPFGEDIARLRSEGTVLTLSLPNPSPREMIFHFMNQIAPSAGPAAKSAVLIFLDMMEPESIPKKEALQFLGNSLSTDLKCLVDQALVHYNKVVLAMPPAAPQMIDTMKAMLKPTMEVPRIIAVDLTDISRNDVTERDMMEDSSKQAPIEGPGWSCTAAVSYATAKAVEVIVPGCQVEMCATCWGSHDGPCGDIQTKVTSPNNADEQEICLRCLGNHEGTCRAGNRTCSHCDKVGHLFYVHEVKDTGTKEAIKFNFGLDFDFVEIGQANRPIFQKPGQGRGSATKSKMKAVTHSSQPESAPRLTFAKKK